MGNAKFLVLLTFHKQQPGYEYDDEELCTAGDRGRLQNLKIIEVLGQ